jgi:hypothetical protein
LAEQVGLIMATTVTMTTEVTTMGVLTTVRMAEQTTEETVAGTAVVAATVEAAATAEEEIDPPFLVRSCLQKTLRSHGSFAQAHNAKRN